MPRQFGGSYSNKGNDKARVILFGSAFFVIFFSTLAYFLLGTQKQQKMQPAVVVQKEKADVKMVSVLVPAQDISTGTPLEYRLFRKETRPQVGVSDRVIQNFEEIKGHYARTLIVKGQPLNRELITAVRPINELTAEIPEGFRAVTIGVDIRTSVEGFVRPGARVDVVWASRIRGKPSITTIVENAKVLSAERQTRANVAESVVPNTVTLLVTVRDAQKIQLATTTGKLNLSLRGDADTGAGTSAGSITLDDLIGGTRERKVQENVEGTVTVGGEKWLLVDGKLKPATSRGKVEAE